MGNFEAIKQSGMATGHTLDASAPTSGDAEALALFASLFDLVRPDLERPDQANSKHALDVADEAATSLTPTAEFMASPAAINPSDAAAHVDFNGGDPRLSDEEVMAFLTDAPQESGDRLTRLLMVASQIVGENVPMTLKVVDVATDPGMPDQGELATALLVDGGREASERVLSAADVISQALALMQHRQSASDVAAGLSVGQPVHRVPSGRNAVLHAPSSNFVGPMPMVQLTPITVATVGPMPLASYAPTHSSFIGPMPMVPNAEALNGMPQVAAGMPSTSDGSVLSPDGLPVKKRDVLSVATNRSGQADAEIVSTTLKDSFEGRPAQAGANETSRNFLQGAGRTPDMPGEALRVSGAALEPPAAASGGNSSHNQGAAVGQSVGMNNAQQSGQNGSQSGSQGFSSQTSLDAGGDASNRVLSHRLNMSQSGWPETMVRRLESDLRSGVQTIRIILEPRHLGRLNVELGLRNGRAAIRVAAETVEAAHRLGQARGQLNAMLETSGLRLASFQTAVDLTGGGPSSDMGSGRDGQTSADQNGKSGSGEQSFAHNMDQKVSDEQLADTQLRSGETAVLSILA